MLPDPEEETREALLNPDQKTRESSWDRKEKAREAPSDPEEETQEESLNPEETHKAPPNPEGEPREAPSDPGVERNDVAGLAALSTHLKGPVIPARPQLTISDNLSPNNVNAHVESTGACRREKSSAAKFSADERRSRRGRRRGECVDVRRRGHDDFSGRWSYRSRSRGACHLSCKPAADGEGAGDGRVEESSEKEEMKGGSTE